MAKCIGESTLGTPPDTYLYALAQSGSTFASIGSDDSLRLFDGSLRPTNKVTSAHSGISCLSSHENSFITAGRDGAIRAWDTRAKHSAAELSEPRNNGFSSIACRDRYIAAGTESTSEGLGNVNVLLYDTRNPSAPLRDYGESHTDSITQLAFHPTQPNLLLSGSTDGLVSIFDVEQQEEEDALQQVLNPRSAIHCSGFLSPTEVYVVTTDEHFSIYSLGDGGSETDKSMHDLGDVREKLRCMYVIDVTTGAAPIMAYGHNVDQRLSVVQLDASQAWGFGSMIDLPGAHGEEVVRDLMLLDQEKKALSCGEDGKVKVWDLAKAVPRAL